MEDTIAEKLATIAENEQNVFNAGYEKGLASGGVAINNQDKTITENGVYQADEGYTGLGTVTVEVASTGGGDIDAFIDRSITEVTSNVERIGAYAFYNCEALETINFPLVTTINTYAFFGCYALTIINTSKIKKIASNAFANCYSLKTVVLRENQLATLDNQNAFNKAYHFTGTVDATYNPNGLKDGYIYVPRALVESYKTATNWSNYASQFRALEDYTVDGTITGELDESKI